MRIFTVKREWSRVQIKVGNVAFRFENNAKQFFFGLKVIYVT